ncbi:lipopolysaccharide biosynthesis protein [Methylorubrum extorquens]|uniref:Lipopolysaccharide biosynthesis protein n=1 Tax=Methylorubrum extorquens TaxID=408 RepID=A0AAX3WEM4_METEX|nr:MULTISPECIES: polysaccharide biosynthesis C-terminal domain-containing protein [Methylobacteriaceae]KQO88300.1 teichoic acid transporter [Methylobacterium sp. Leaf92]KQQ12508.1 teichoic acid transporter [Methylobacterium sp. Leaf122]WHQ69973.1 lipopolysaccharide biosynthesis protein [Methylorubrum extorquens]
MAVIAAFVLNAGLNFILGIAIARMLGPADFGRFALATAGAVVLNTILFEWLRLSATRFYSARVREAEPWIRQGLDRAYWVIALALFATAALCAGLGIAVNPTPEGRLVMTAGTMVAAIGIGLFDYHAALARARFIGGAYLRLVVWKNVLAFVLMAGTAWLFPQPVWVLIAGGLSQFLAVLPMRKILGDGLLGHAPAITPDRARKTLRLFAAYGLPLIAANAVYQIMPFLNRAAIAGTAGFAEAGYFALAADLGSRAFSTLGAALDLLLFQIAVQAEEHHGREAAETQVARNIAIVVALLLPCAAGYWAVTPALQALIVPEEFRGPFADYTDLLIPGLFCLSIMNFALNPIFQIRRRTSPVVAAALIGLAVNAVGLVLLPRMMGPQGVAVAQTLGLVAAVAVLGLRALTGIERLRLPGRDLALTAAACLAMVLAVLPFRGLEPALALPACIAAGMLVYGAFVWFLDIAGLRSAVRQRFPKRLPAAAR